MMIDLGATLSMLGVLTSIVFSVSAMWRSRKHDTAADTEAFITVKILLGQVSQKVDGICHKMDENQNCTSSLAKSIALSEQRIASLEARVKAVERTEK